jgi:hypothetical protein
MDLLARQVAAVAMEKRLTPQRPPHSLFIRVEGSHPLFQQFSQQPGNAGIPARRLDASPLGDVLFEGDGYIA